MVDQAGLLDPRDRDRLDAKLTEHQRNSGQQMVLLIVPTLDGDVLEDVAVRVFERWGIGKKGKDDGLLMLVVTRDRHVRIEVGDGLEGDITDALAGRIVRNVIAPAFRNQDYVGGLDRAFDALMTAAAGTAPTLPADVDNPRAKNRSLPIPAWAFWVGLWLIFAFLRAAGGRRAGMWGTAAVLGSIFSGRSGGGWGGGGSGGGFSGGGGGRSSGGGASGGW